jgi:16S rRNA processing protein RimM
VQNYGAGDMIEITLDRGGVEILPFTRAVVPVVDLDQGLVVVDPPHEIYVRPDAAGDPGVEQKEADQ